jgi:hypothetical protein
LSGSSTGSTRMNAVAMTVRTTRTLLRSALPGGRAVSVRRRFGCLATVIDGNVLATTAHGR